MNKQELKSLLQKQIEKCETNSFIKIGHKEESIWGTPMVGFASGNDPLFRFFKEDIGEFYLTPAEVFKTKYRDENRRDEDLTVISLAFSQAAATKEEQKSQKEEPCLRWMVARNTWKTVSGELYAHISGMLSDVGIMFAIPDLMKEMEIKRSAKYGDAAVWSQRHTAYAAGLGTFGLSEGLITEQGIAMRFVSMVVGQKFEPDKREYEKHQEWCLFYRDGSCGACIERCPAGAITKDGHDKEKCNDYLNNMGKKHLNNPLFDPKVEVGCGLCQSAVPCADRNFAFRKAQSPQPV